MVSLGKSNTMASLCGLHNFLVQNIENVLRYWDVYLYQRAIQGQLPRVFLVMSVPDGGMCGRHSSSTSPSSSVHSRYHHPACSFCRSPRSLFPDTHSGFLTLGVLSLHNCSVGRLLTFATFVCLAASKWLPGHQRSAHHVSNPHRPDYY